jgi:hypothetical protein
MMKIVSNINAQNASQGRYEKRRQRLSELDKKRRLA